MQTSGVEVCGSSGGKPQISAKEAYTRVGKRESKQVAKLRPTPASGLAETTG
jgi:hypothetical protein